MLTRFTNSEITEVDSRKFRFVISDETVDRYGTVIKMSGWKLENYARNGVVAYNHWAGSSNPNNVVGKGRAWVENGRLMGEVEFEPAEMNPVAEKIIQKLKFGTIKSASVGFDPHEWTKGVVKDGEDPNVLYFRSQDLLEWSIVDIPANPSATVQNGYDEFVKMALDEMKENTKPNKEEPAAITGPDIFKNKLFTLKLNTL